MPPRPTRRTNQEVDMEGPVVASATADPACLHPAAASRPFGVL